MKRILLVGAPFRFYGGGERRNFYLLQEYVKLGLSVTLFIPIGEILEILYNDISAKVDSELKMIEELKLLERSGVQLPLEMYQWIQTFAKERRRFVGIDTHGLRSLFKKLGKRKVEKRLINRLIRKIDPPEIILSYGGHFAQQVSFKFARGYRKPFMLMLGSEPFKAKEYRRKRLYNRYDSLVKRLLFDGLITWYRNHFFSLNFKAYVKSGLLISIISVSRGPIEESQLMNILSDVVPVNFMPGYAVLTEPGMAILPGYSTELPKLKKRFQIIYYARLSPEKGVFDIVDIIARVQREVPTKLWVAGNFYSFNVKEAFFRRAREENLDFEYLGYLSGNALYQKIKESWVFANPSHSDAFSTAISEATLLNTHCVAYSIPGTSSAFAGLPSVRIVDENNIEAFSKAIISILGLTDEEYYEAFKVDKYYEFKDSISSWEKVARKHIKQLDNDLISFNKKLSK